MRIFSKKKVLEMTVRSDRVGVRFAHTERSVGKGD